MILKWLPAGDADPDLEIRLDDVPGTFRYKGRAVKVADLGAAPEDWVALKNLPYEVSYPGYNSTPRGTVVYVRKREQPDVEEEAEE